MVNPYDGPDLTHKHEFEAQSDDCIEVDYEYIWVREPCLWAEVTSAQTSEKHDETFYGYGAECQAERVTSFECTDVHGLVDAEDVTFTDVVTAIEDAEMETIQRLAHDAVLDDARSFEVGIVYDGQPYRLHYERESQRIENEGEFA